jgi:hypothetical protein
VAVRILRQPLLAFGVALTIMISPILLHMAVAPLHLETWIAAAVFWAYYFYLRGSFIGFVSSLLFACCCGEQAALICIALGLALVVTDEDRARGRKFGWSSFLGGIAWILLALFVIQPLNRHSGKFNIFAYNYAQWNIQSAAQLPGAVLSQPMLVLSCFSDAGRWVRVAALIGFPLFLTLFSLRTAILLLPLPVYFLMSDQEYFLYFHAYYFTFAFFAAYLALIYLFARPAVADRFRLLLVLLAATFLVNLVLVCDTCGFYNFLTAVNDETMNVQLHEIFPKIPTDATVYTCHRYSAYLSNRENFVIGDLKDPNLNFDEMVDARIEDTNVRADQIDYIVCDFLTDQCGWRMPFTDAPEVKQRELNVRHLIESGRWQLFWNGGTVVILKRAGA